MSAIIKHVHTSFDNAKSEGARFGQLFKEEIAFVNVITIDIKILKLVYSGDL